MNLSPGVILGHKYRVQDLIGSGGMSHVYRAVNLTSHRTVAIKILKEEYVNDAEFLRRFEREAKAVLHLSHDNIVSAYDVGEFEGLPYIVLEYVEGQTLKQIIVENGPMPARLAVALATQVLDALNAAHNAGIIHRDVKPQNVIITPTGKAMLTDFGIARDVSATTMTFVGSTILGSVHYLSPEQAKGKPVTEASDLYSVGVMLYEMVTGRVPFDSDNTVAIALMHLREDPVPPITLNPKLPPALNDVIMRAMNRDLTKRYATAMEMTRHLRRALSEPNGSFARTYAPEAPPAQQPGAATKKKKKKRHVSGALLIGSVVAAVVIVLIGVFFIVRGSFQSEAGSLEIIPTLTEKTAEEARQKAENYGFVFEVAEYEVSDAIPYGSVLLQTPAAGTKAKRGSVISVTVSLGPDAPTMPSLIGMTPDEAEAALKQTGLLLGSTQYRVSDTEIGYVCAQSVLAGAEVLSGTPVDIWISATSAETFEMPTMTDEILNLSLAALSEHGFSAVYVRYEPKSKVENGIVLSQSPEPGAAVVTSTPVYITVSGMPAYGYFTDAAFNVDIANNDTDVSCMMQESFNGFAYYRVVYEATLQKGDKIPVSFTAYADTDGIHELILYVSGEEVRRQDYAFTERLDSK